MADHDALIKEIQQLRKLHTRWRAVAIASLFLVFVVMLPFTVAVEDLMDRHRQRFEPQIVVPPASPPKGSSTQS
ncbi:MAG TPA: hypothetical protein VG099_07285 [Gemmataceae bacterium]|jgi:hypothetical protein|nr:hypothetical protein [Gemmataceae bacterium]